MYIFTHVCAWRRYFFGNCEWVGCWIWLFQVKERFNCWSWWPVSALSKWGKIVAFVRRQGKCRVHKKSNRTKISKTPWSVDFWLFSEQPSQWRLEMCQKYFFWKFFEAPWHPAARGAGPVPWREERQLTRCNRPRPRKVWGGTWHDVLGKNLFPGLSHIFGIWCGEFGRSIWYQRMEWDYACPASPQPLLVFVFVFLFVFVSVFASVFVFVSVYL